MNERRPPIKLVRAKSNSVCSFYDSSSFIDADKDAQRSQATNTVCTDDKLWHKDWAQTQLHLKVMIS